MKTTVSSKGQIVLPAEFRREDRIEPGQEFEVERLARGEYRLKRRSPMPNEREIAVDPIVFGELRFGILLLPQGKRRARLENWFDAGVQRLLCLPWEAEAGLRWAELLAALRARGLAMPIKDSLIAATALVHRLIVVTRNRADFEKAGVVVIDPFA